MGDPMGNKNVKTVAIVLIVLLFGYYNKWGFIFLYELISAETSDDPFLPIGTGGGTVFKDFDLDSSDENNWDLALPAKAEGGTGLSNNHDDKDKQSDSDALSEIVQSRLNVLQASSCQRRTVFCGSPVECSLGCQTHYLMTCLMVAYAWNATLIPDLSQWPYKVAWDDIFEPINPLGCEKNNDTLTVLWGKQYFVLTQGGYAVARHRVGLPITAPLALQLQKSFSNPLLWWAGQLANFTLRPLSAVEDWISKTKYLLKFDSAPVAGILLRRRDKKGEKKQPFQSIDRHFTAAKKYFDSMERLGVNLTRRVYVGTDDRSIIKLSRKRYRPPKWEIIGAQRKLDVEDIMKDTLLLSSCDFVVCSFTTDICRLVLELMNSQNLNAVQKVKSLGSKYVYQGKAMNKLRFIFP